MVLLFFFFSFGRRVAFPLPEVRALRYLLPVVLVVGRLLLKIKRVAKAGNLIRDRITLNHSYLLTVTCLSRPGTKPPQNCDALI